jgi:hypothetical protein
MLRSFVLTLSFCGSVAFLDGCATVFNGYFDEVMVTNPRGSLRITTKDGVEIPYVRDTIAVRVNVEVPEVHYIRNDSVIVSHFEYRTERHPVARIRLRSNIDHVLVLESQGKQKVVQVYGKIGAGWVILDLITGGLPVVVDALTGNWNSFDPIDAGFSDGLK